MLENKVTLRNVRQIVGACIRSGGETPGRLASVARWGAANEISPVDGKASCRICYLPIGVSATVKMKQTVGGTPCSICQMKIRFIQQCHVGVRQKADCGAWSKEWRHGD